MREIGELRLAFARAIGRRGGNALLLTRENEYGGWVPLEEAVVSGRSYLVELDNDTLAFDADSPIQRERLLRLADDLRAACLKVVLVHSGRAGHLHGFVRVEDPLLRRAVAAAATASGVTPRRSIRPPFAPHREGLPVSLLEPEDPGEALARLVDAAPRSLSSRIAALLQEGDKAGSYHSRSEVEMAIALGAFQAHWAEPWFFEAMRDRTNVGGAKVQDILASNGEAAARHRVARTWAKAARRADICPAIRAPEDARLEIARLSDCANRIPWPGVAGATDRAVLAAHHWIALRLGRVEYGASVRQVAEEAGVSTPTAHVSQKRLRLRGWLRVTSRGRGDEPTIWRLAYPERAATDSLTLRTSGGREKEC